MTLYIQYKIKLAIPGIRGTPKEDNHLDKFDIFVPKMVKNENS